ncbi:Aromatic/aminoadipate aminotransferase 1 [Madurella mycetomatis]|uniref:Aromatic/aminoadipate aminotransferase 1 n=1 Tax=Madurella mycetomatis TaxID=100816 RepID=A0A175W1Q7_9PEZI|nr:Aromatic/aminoadipate aminotransferase 1 [Madurella mycetomatis]
MENPTCHGDSGVRLCLAGNEKRSPLDLSHHFSEVTKRRTGSKIKEAYKFFQIPGILNAAGGLPNVSFFPFDTLEAQTAKPERWTPTPNYPGRSAATETSSDRTAPKHIVVPKNSGESDPQKKIDLASVLQYGLAQGYPPLLSWVRQFTREHLHPDSPYQGGPEVILTCGSTDGFSKTLNLFVDQWTEGVNDISERPGLLCETFVYANVLNQAMPLGTQIVPVRSDACGMVAKGPGGLEDVLANWDSSKGKRPHLMYTVTLGHNPTGIVLSVERKNEIYAVCSKYDVIIVEDEPYWYLQFPSAAVEEARSRGEPAPAPPQPYKPARSSGYPFLDSLTPSFLSFDTEGRVVRLDTFSKTIAPGCRLGWITAQPALIERLERITETSTQQPSGFVQGLVSELVFGTGQQQHQQHRSSFSFLRGNTATTATSSSSSPGWNMDGWVRWLAGLRGAYERRMARMARTLDAGRHLLLITSPSAPNDDEACPQWQTVSPSPYPLYTFSWPRGGMFIWLRMHLESHPLWQAPSRKLKQHLDGPLLSTALMVWLTTKPYRVLVATGSMFSANEEIKQDIGWAYYRICFAAETEENVDKAAGRFVEGVHAFWGLREVRAIEKLLSEVGASGKGGKALKGMGC